MRKLLWPAAMFLAWSLVFLPSFLSNTAPAEPLTDEQKVAAFDFVQNFDDDFTIRDWFAGHAMGGMLGRYSVRERDKLKAQLAKQAYEYADAMMAERKKHLAQP